MRRCRYGRLGMIMFSGIRKAPTLGLERCIVGRFEAIWEGTVGHLGTALVSLS
jgi:hypothetical protein